MCVKPAGRDAVWPLVGRQGELDTRASLIDDPTVGGAALFGAAGVGKTRLAREALERAKRRGFATASVRATRMTSRIGRGLGAARKEFEAGAKTGDVAAA